MADYGTSVWISASPDGNMPVWISASPDGNTPVFSGSIDYARYRLFSTSIDYAQMRIFLTGCFPASELVHTSPDSRVPIGALKVGDRISSWDAERKKAQYTAVTGIHKYQVKDIITINNNMRVSSSHPLMVMDEGKDNMLVPQWKVAFDVRVGDYLVGADGELVVVRMISRRVFDTITEVLNLSTDSGVPFLVSNCVVRADNATDSIKFADTPITQKLLTA